MNIVKVNHLKMECALDRLMIFKNGITSEHQCKIISDMATEYYVKKIKMSMVNHMKNKLYSLDRFRDDDRNEYVYEFQIVTDREEALIDQIKTLINNLKNSTETFDISEWVDNVEKML